MAVEDTYSAHLEQALRALGDGDAIQDVGGETVSGYALLHRINAVANLFWDIGLRPGDGVVQLAHNRIDAFAVMAGALRAGVRYTPLHPLGSEKDQLFIIGDTEARVLVLDNLAFPERSKALAEASGVGSVITFTDCHYGEVLREQLPDGASGPHYLPKGSDIAWVSYTGGTTGTPKGAMHSQAGMAKTAELSIASWEFPDSPRLLACSPISHAAGFMVLPVLSLQGQVLLLPGFSPESVCTAIEREGVNALFLVPTMIYALLDYVDLDRRDLSNLEHMIYASAPMDPERLREALHVFGPIMLQCYGQTESIHIACLSRANHRPADSRRLGSAGRVTPGMALKVCQDDGQIVVPGAVGEVWISGPCVMQGYWGDPEETAATLVDGWLRTGDLGYLDEEGFLHLVDRKKDLIISGGFNVYSQEVEKALASHPGVAQCAVVGLADPRWGERVHALVVPSSQGSVADTELIEFVRDLKGPLLAPKSLEFVDQLPLTNLGKVDKRAIRAARQ